MRASFKAIVALAGLVAAGSASAADFARPDILVRDRRAAESGYQVGTLTCRTKGGVSYLIGSEKELACEYTPIGASHPVDVYLGHIGRIGVDVGATGASVLKWGVVARSSDIGPGALAGRYRGASASATALIGGGANLLVGGSRATISLQPLSFEGQTGINVAAGYSSLTLDPI